MNNAEFKAILELDYGVLLRKIACLAQIDAKFSTSVTLYFQSGMMVTGHIRACDQQRVVIGHLGDDTQPIRIIHTADITSVEFNGSKLLRLLLIKRDSRLSLDKPNAKLKLAQWLQHNVDAFNQKYPADLQLSLDDEWSNADEDDQLVLELHLALLATVLNQLIEKYQEDAVASLSVLRHLRIKLPATHHVRIELAGDSLILALPWSLTALETSSDVLLQQLSEQL